jgi:hypothetical protein
MAQMMDFHEVQETVETAPRIFHAIELGEDPQIFGNRQVHREIHAHRGKIHPSQNLDAVPFMVPAEDLDPSRRRTNESQDYLQRRGFSCPIGPKDADDFAVSDGKTQAIDRHDVVEPLGQITNL